MPFFIDMMLFSITKSARGRPRKGEAKQDKYKRKKDRGKKPFIRVKLDANLFEQHKVHETT